MFFFDYILRPLLNLLSFVMEETRRRKQGGMQVEHEMPGQLKKHIAAWRIRDMLKELIRQGHCEDRFIVSVEEDVSMVSVSVTAELLLQVRLYETDFELIVPGFPDKRIESEYMLQKMACQKLADRIAWHKEIMTLGGKRR